MSTTEIESKKRKRPSADTEELEIDVSQPEPLSRKEARRAKKGKPAASNTTAVKSSSLSDLEDDDSDKETSKTRSTAKDTSSTESKRSEHAIWIGNLAFSIDRTALRSFLTERGGLDESQITRIHMPTPNSGKAKSEGSVAPKFKPSNKGYAYVDFDSADALSKGLALTENLLNGRKVLIKDAKSFSGRPEKKETDAGSAAASAASGGKPPSKRVFVGNLAFDVTKDMLQEHFAQAGEVEHIHMATFEDSGKCKGFAWVTFADLDAAKGAVLGYILKTENESDDDDDEHDDGDDDENNKIDDDGEAIDTDDKDAIDAPMAFTKKTARRKAKPRKWYINRINGRSLRCEYAEDSTTRYNKRYRSGKPDATGGADGATAAVTELEAKQPRIRGDKDERAEQRRKKHADARLIRPGAALANAPRASGAIVEGSGTKVKFDD